MKFLLLTNQCMTDTTAGVSHSIRQIMVWLAQAGHDARCLCTSRFETRVTLDEQEHITDWDENFTKQSASPCDFYRFDMQGVATTLLCTKHHNEAEPDHAESDQYLQLFTQMIQQDKPDVLITLNSHPMILRALAMAKQAGITTAFALRGYGYEDRRFFEHVDHAFTCSDYLTKHFRKAIGLHSTPLEPPIDWSTVVPPEDVDASHRRFVTFINPMPTKGVVLFAKLADMLGSSRPDIPILIIQSGISAGHLHEITNMNLAQYPQIMVGPATPEPWEIYALTKMLLVPSVWPEPFGRVAAEAMINGIVPLVSERGGLPDVIGGDAKSGGAGRVLPIPQWLTPKELRLPSEAEVQPWYDAVVDLWDHPSRYDILAKRGQAMAQARYSEAVSKEKHRRYFESLTGEASTGL